MNNKGSFLKLINTLHLWVGVPCAIVLFIVCLTGTLYVFQKEITRWIDSDKYKLAASAQPRMRVAALVDTLEKQNSPLKVTILQIPEKADEAWLFTLAPAAKKDTGTAKKDTGTAKKETAADDKAEIKKQTRLLIVNPFTGAIQGDAKTTAYSFFENVIALHRWLLLDHKIGAAITGTSALLFVLLEITGLMLWLPPKLKSWKKWKAWKPGFQVKSRAGWKRVNHDLHKTLGFYTFFLITILGLTGPYFGFEWYKTGLTRLMGVEPVPAPTKSHPPAAGPSVSLDSILTNAAAIFPYSGDIRLNLPKSAKAPVALLKTRTGFFTSAAIDKADFDASTGKPKKIDRFSDRSTGEKIISLMRAIHTGELFGTCSKLIYFIVCLIATSLPVTGVMIWLNKRRKRIPRQSYGNLKLPHPSGI